MAGPGTRTIDFNKLPKETRERFSAATRDEGSPSAIVSTQLGMGMAALGWGSLLVAALGTLGVAAAGGFGRVSSIQSPAWAGLYVAAIFVAVYSVLAMVRRWRLLKSLPFAPGRYLFPMDFVDATSNTLRIVPVAGLIDFRGVHHHTNGVYTHTELTFSFEDGSREAFTVKGRDNAEYIMQRLRSAQLEVRQAVEERSVERLWMLDVFCEARLDGWEVDPKPFAEGAIEGPTAAPLGALLRRAALVAVGVSLIGVPTWYLRNRSSDDAAYARMQRAPRVYEVERYIELGGRHAAEAKAELLPKAALQEAKQQGSVTALRGVVERFGDHAVAKEANEQIDALFAKTVDDFHRQAADDPEMKQFMDRLFKHLHDAGRPTVTVRFGKPSATALEKADELLDAEVTGGVVPISGHFDEGSSAPREAAIVRYLQDAFAAIFPADILQLEHGTRLTQAATDKREAPTIEIHYDVSPSGDTYTSEQSGKNFVGIRVRFDVALELPGEGEEFSFMLTVEPPERFQVSSSPLDRYGVGSYQGDSAGRVYHAMATNAFGQLANRMREVFFRPGTEAYAGRNPDDAGRLQAPRYDLPALPTHPEL
jgi:hypothetical protein